MAPRFRDEGKREDAALSYTVRADPGKQEENQSFKGVQDAVAQERDRPITCIPVRRQCTLPTTKNHPCLFPTCLLHRFFSSQSIVNDLGRSMGNPKALDQVSWDRTPMARLVPNRTV